MWRYLEPPSSTRRLIHNKTKNKRGDYFGSLKLTGWVSTRHAIHIVDGGYELISVTPLFLGTGKHEIANDEVMYLAGGRFHCLRNFM